MLYTQKSIQTVGSKTLRHTLPNFMLWHEHEHTKLVNVSAFRKANPQQVAEYRVGTATIYTEPIAFTQHANVGQV